MRELVRAGPIPEASPCARRYLEAIEHAGDSMLEDANDALAILYANEKMAFIEELGERLRTLDPEHPLHEHVQSFIEQMVGLLARM